MANWVIIQGCTEIPVPLDTEEPQQHGVSLQQQRVDDPDRSSSSRPDDLGSGKVIQGFEDEGVRVEWGFFGVESGRAKMNIYTTTACRESRTTFLLPMFKSRLSR